MSDSRVQNNREILQAAQAKGTGATILAFFRLSGPGWLQSAITLGGGSLAGALYLGMLGGTSMLWLQLVAIIIGVIMLSAISYVTLSTGKRPYAAINEYVNPVLGVGWLVATILANMIWIMPQFSLCFDSLTTTQLGTFSDFEGVTPEYLLNTKIVVSAIIGILAFGIVVLGFQQGIFSKIFDWVLRILVGFVVICFVGVVVVLAFDQSLDWNAILMGLIPNVNHWNTTSPDLQNVMTSLSSDQQAFWKEQIIGKQQMAMITVTATAVGLNMTFLLPYSMLARGWDRPFRGLARFDLIMGLAIPFFIVTSCIVIASAHAFHAKADVAFLDSDPKVVSTSPFYNELTKKSAGVLEARYKLQFSMQEKTRLEDMTKAERVAELSIHANSMDSKSVAELTDDEIKASLIDSVGQKALDDFKKLKPEEQKEQMLAFVTSEWSQEERKLAATLAKPKVSILARSLEPLLGERNANLVFGLGALAMGFSTIIILMIINGYAFAEIAGQYNSTMVRSLGALAAGVVGFLWWLIWAHELSNTWLVIVASTFGAILLPIAYFSFFALMNNKRLLGADRPTGIRWIVGNILMLIGVAGATIQAVAAVNGKLNDPDVRPYMIAGLATFLTMALVGFSARLRRPQAGEN